MRIEEAASRVCHSMSALTPGAGEYERLRSAYESAYREFTIRVRRFQTALHQSGVASASIQEARERLAQAEAAYRRSRDRLAEHVLAQGRPASA